MERFLRLFLSFNLLLFLSLSCKTYELDAATEVNNETSTFENLYFSSSEDLVYKANFEVYRNSFSGILVLKKISENTHRAALTTDFGNKLMDFEISGENFKINYIAPDLDKKMIKNFIKKDFSLLLKKDFPISKTFTAKAEKIYLSKSGKTSFFWMVSSNTFLPKQMNYVVNGREKINFILESTTPLLEDKLQISHHDLKIKLILKKLNS